MKLKITVQPHVSCYLNNLDINKIERAYVKDAIDHMIVEHGIPRSITITSYPHIFDADGKDIKPLRAINGLYRAQIPGVKEIYFTLDAIMNYLKAVWFDFGIICEYGKD